MNSDGVDSDSSLKNARRLGLVFFAYAIALPFISFILPESGNPLTESISIISWTLILMMPVDILLVYLFYWIFRKKTASYDIMGPAVLMYTVASVPSVYAFVIGFINSTLRYLAAPLGLMLSLTGLWLSLRFVSSLGEMVWTPSE